MSDNPTIAGKGREILLPPEGNPFDREGGRASSDDTARYFGKTASSPTVAGFGDEPMDLAPEDIAARFPSEPDERNAIPGAPSEPQRPMIKEAAKSSFIPQPSADAANASPPAVNPAPPPEPAPVVSAPASGAEFEPATPFSRLAAPPTGEVLVSPGPGEMRPQPLMTNSPPSSRHDQPGPGGEPRAAALPVPPVPEQEAMVSLLVTDQRINDLWTRIEALEKMVVADENSRPSRQTVNLENLKGARNLLLGGRKNFEDAQRYVAEVEASLQMVGRVRRWSYTYGLLVLAYNLLWLVLLAWGYASARWVANFFGSSAVVDAEFGFTIWITVLSGGLGGVSGALYALWVHVAKEQDFDRQHLMWYLTNPLMGCVLGIFVFMVAQVGIVTLSGGGASTGNALFILYILAWVAGFQQNVAYQLVQQAINLILKPKEPDKGREAQPLAAQAPSPDDQSR